MSSKFIYPIDVEKRSADANKLVGGEKIKLTIFLIILGNGLIMLFTVPFFTSIGIPWWVPVGVQVTLLLVVGIFILRMFVFKEDEKIREQEGELVDSFSKYYNLRNLDSADIISNNNIKASIYEYMNGNAMFVLALKFGSNDNHKKVNTRQTVRDLYKLLGTRNLVVRDFIMKEDFEHSLEYADHVNKLSNNEDTKLSKVALELSQEALNFAKQKSNVDVRYMLVQTRYASQKFDLPEVIHSLLLLFEQRRTSFRSIEFLGKVDFIEFMRVQYGLGAIDLALMKSSIPESEMGEFGDLVSIYQFVAVDKFGVERKLSNNELLIKSTKSMRRLK